MWRRKRKIKRKNKKRTQRRNKRKQNRRRKKKRLDISVQVCMRKLNNWVMCLCSDIIISHKSKTDFCYFLQFLMLMLMLIHMKKKTEVKQRKLLMHCFSFLWSDWSERCSQSVVFGFSSYCFSVICYCCCFVCRKKLINLLCFSLYNWFELSISMKRD